jgi:hypothetical protein
LLRYRPIAILLKRFRDQIWRLFSPVIFMPFAQTLYYCTVYGLPLSCFESRERHVILCVRTQCMYVCVQYTCIFCFSRIGCSFSKVWFRSLIRLYLGSCSDRLDEMIIMLCSGRFLPTSLKRIGPWTMFYLFIQIYKSSSPTSDATS